MHCCRDLSRFIRHDNDVRCFDCCIGSHASHCDSDISSGEYRCIIDTVSDKDQPAFFRLFRQQLFYMIYFIARQKLCIILCNTKLPCHLICNTLLVSCQHNKPHTCFFQLCYTVCCIFFELILDQ